MNRYWLGISLFLLAPALALASPPIGHSRSAIPGQVKARVVEPSFPGLRIYLQIEFGGNVEREWGLKHALGETSFDEALDEMEAALLGRKTPRTASLTEDQRRWRRIALTIFLMREYETNQLFDERAQSGREDAMKRFQSELHENYIDTLNDHFRPYKELSKYQKAQFTLAGDRLRDASKNFSDIPVNPINHPPDDFLKLFKIMNDGCPSKSEKDAVRKLSKIFSYMVWNDETRRQVLNQILFPGEHRPAPQHKSRSEKELESVLSSLPKN